eukprot:scaffold297904_cov31-Tisochrysis_lutea.AAC.3
MPRPSQSISTTNAALECMVRLLHTMFCSKLHLDIVLEGLPIGWVVPLGNKVERATAWTKINAHAMAVAHGPARKGLALTAYD